MSLFLNTRERRLIQAIEDNNLDYINHLLNSKKSLNINYKSKNNFTPLLLAASLSGREEIIKIILNSKNVNVNLRTKDNETALHLAIPHYNLEIIQLLIEKEINLNEKDKYGKTALARIIELIKKYTIPNEVLNESIINFATAPSVYSDDSMTSITIENIPEQNSGSDKGNEEKVLSKLKKRKALNDESLFDEISLSSDFSWIDNDDSGSLEACENYIESLSISLKQMDFNEMTNNILNSGSREDYANNDQNLNENLMVNTNFGKNNIGKDDVKEDNMESAKTIANENENELDNKLKYGNEFQDEKYLKDPFKITNLNKVDLYKEVNPFKFNNIMTNQKEMNIMSMNVEVKDNNDYLQKQYLSAESSDLKTPIFRAEVVGDQNPSNYYNHNGINQQQLTEEVTELRFNSPTSNINASTGSVTLHDIENVINEEEKDKLSNGNLSNNESLESLENLESLESSKLTALSSFTEYDLSSTMDDETPVPKRTNHLSLLPYSYQYEVSIGNGSEFDLSQSYNKNNTNGELNSSQIDDITPRVLKYDSENNNLNNNRDNDDNDNTSSNNNNTSNKSNNTSNNSNNSNFNTNTNTFNNNNNNNNNNDNNDTHGNISNDISNNITPQMNYVHNDTNGHNILEIPTPLVNYDMSLQDCQQEIKQIKLSDVEDDEEQEGNDIRSNSKTISEFGYLPSEIKGRKQDLYRKDFCGESNINLNITDNNSFVESIIPYENITLDSIFISRKPSRTYSLSERRKYRNRYSTITLSDYDKLRLSQNITFEKSGRVSRTLSRLLNRHQRSISDLTDQSSFVENESRGETHHQKVKKYTAMLELLLWNDADPNIQDLEGRTSLILACIYRLRQVVPILLRYGTSVNTKDYLGKTALMYSCEKQEDGIVKQLLEYHSNVNLQDNNGLTALMLSCKFDNEEIIRPLLENGARINRQDKNGDTALTYASRYGCTKAVYLLMRCNANGNIKNKRGETALIIACRHVNEGIIHILINQPIDIDLQDRNGNTALIYLCQKKNEYTELVREFLLKHNVNVNIKNKAGNSALHIAVFNNHLEIVKLLLFNHADINLKNGDGNTVLMMVSSSSNREQMLQLLLSFSEVYVSPRNIVKVLQLRKKRKLKKEQLEELLLLNTYLDIDAVNNEGDSALLIASRNGNPRIVNTLLQRHANCNLQNYRQETALIKAIKSMSKCSDKEPIEKYKQIIELLILNNSDTHLKDYKKRDFVYYAKSNKLYMQILRTFSKQKSSNSNNITNITTSSLSLPKYLSFYLY
jgi:ankyrin repeat protein